MAVVKIMMIAIAMTAPAVVLGGCSRPPNPISNNDGGYSVQIGIKDDISEDPAIIDGLRELFTEASRTLFIATKNYVYFRYVTILVPSNWTGGLYKPAQQESYGKAHVIVTPSSKDKPYVKQTSVECGCAGMFMHFTPNYLLNKKVSEQNYGKRDKLLVRLWAMLQWGVFLENYDEEHNSIVENVQPFYQVGNDHEGTRCSASIKGNLKTDGIPCKPDPFGGLDPSCRFVPSTDEEQTATASLMFDSGGIDIPTMNEFCHNNESHPEGLHNRRAPNLQNLLCSHKSVWEVMLSSDDFSKSRRPLPSSTNTTPEIRVVQHGANRRVALILDTSGSMNIGNKLVTVRRAAEHYLTDILPSGSYVFIVDFNYDAIASDLVQLVDLNSRNRVIEKLPTDGAGATCIGCGIEKAIEVLQKLNASDSFGANLILVSDGEENRLPLIRDTWPLIDQSGVIIYTIALAEEADPQLTNLSTSNGGLPFACSIQNGVECVTRAFQDTVTGSPQAFQDAPILHVSSMMESEPHTSEFVSFPVEPSVGRDLTITVSWMNNDMMSLTLLGPDGEIVDDGGTTHVLDSPTDSKMTTIRVKEAKAGEWTLEISNPNDAEEIVGVSVNSKPMSSNDAVVVVNAYLDTLTVNYEEDPSQTLYAYIHINQQAVLDANVTAQVESATGDLHRLQLHDYGKGADFSRGDGIYSAYFLSFTTNGRYGVKIDATGSTENTPADAGYQFARDVSTNSSSFSRTASAGVFEVINYVSGPKPDNTAPSMITDFSVFGTENRNESCFKWTAVGDDLDQGTASHYELRYSKDYDTILDDWAACTQVNQSDLLAGRLSPVAPAGTQESVTLPFQWNDEVYYAIRAVDESGNAGGLSNILRVVPPSPPLPGYTTTNGIGLSTKANALPTTSDTLLTTSDPKSTTSDPQLTKSDAMPTTSGNLPTSSHAPSTISDALPTSNDESPVSHSRLLCIIISVLVAFFTGIGIYLCHNNKKRNYSPPEEEERIRRQEILFINTVYTVTNPLPTTDEVRSNMN